MTELVAGLVAVALTGWWWAGLLAYGAVYLVGAWWWPWARCLRCGGRGKFFRRGGKAWRDCPWCSGKGRRFRAGAVLVARYRDRRRT